MPSSARSFTFNTYTHTNAPLHSPIFISLSAHTNKCTLPCIHSLLMEAPPPPPSPQLPVTLYESLMDIVDGKPRVVFSQVSYNLATEEAERVGVDHIAKETVATGTHTSAVTDHLSVHYGAIRMLHTRIQFVVDYLRAVQAGKLIGET